MKFIMATPRQYLINYTINGMPVGSSFVISLDFPTSKIGKTASETSSNLFECIMDVHNKWYTPKIEYSNVIGIVSMIRLD